MMPRIYNNVEKQRAGTEAEDVGMGSRSFLIFKVSVSYFKIIF